MSEFSYQNTMANNLYQQQLNGIYRTVQLLEKIALKLGCNSSKVSSIMSEFSYQNTMANNIYQQQLNGYYRTVELLNLIVSPPE